MKKIILTMDDCPSNNFKEKLEYLSEKKITCFFFCIGSKIEINRDILIESIKKGYIICNHSFSHKSFSKLNLKIAKQEIIKTENLIDELYKDANIKRIKYFRYPYGNKGITNYLIKTPFKFFSSKYLLLNIFLKKKGFKKLYLNKHILNFLLNLDYDCYWTYDLEDWKIKILNYPKEYLVDKLDKLNKKKTREVVLIHDYDNNFEEFKYIIDHLIFK